MSELKIRQRGRASLLSEADMVGMVFNTPVPFFDMTVSCGNPLEMGNIAPVMMMMPDQVLGVNDVMCTRAGGESMIDVGIMPGDLLFLERVTEYYSGDIVLAEIDGERLLKTYYIDERGEQWLVPANKKFKARRLDGSMNVRFIGRLVHHMRKAPRQSMQSIAESINEARVNMDGKMTEPFRLVVVKPECADKVIARLHELMNGKSKPKDMLMPLRAAMEAGAIRRPTWAEFIAEFGSKRASKTSLSDYTDTTKEKYEGEPQFLTMVDDFRHLIAH